MYLLDNMGACLGWNQAYPLRQMGTATQDDADRQRHCLPVSHTRSTCLTSAIPSIKVHRLGDNASLLHSKLLGVGAGGALGNLDGLLLLLLSAFLGSLGRLVDRLRRRRLCLLLLGRGLRCFRPAGFWFWRHQRCPRCRQGLDVGRGRPRGGAEPLTVARATPGPVLGPVRALSSAARALPWRQGAV